MNIDGLPLFKSSNKNLWPILACIVENKNTNTIPFPIALFCGNGKPSNCTDFLRDFLIEYKELNENGLTVNQNHYFCKINALVCDAPARQYLKFIKSHNGYYGCERCVIKGESIERRMIFHSIHESPRSTESFESLVYSDHQLGKSPLIDSTIDPIKDFPLDYMHLVLLGTVRRLLLFLKEGPKICKLSSRQLSEISEKLDSYRNNIPSELARQPRGLAEIKKWKATEFRQFLLFTGPVVLKGTIDENYYIHFLSLSVAMRNLLESNDVLRNRYLAYSHSLLEYFVLKCPSLYGNTFTTYNVHNLIHLKQDSEYFNSSLDTVSAFPFENYLQTLKKHVKSGNNPISQIVKRRNEIEVANYHRLRKQTHTSISSTVKDSWFLLNCTDVAQVFKITKDGDLRCNVFRHKYLQPLFESPCKSTLVNIFRVRKNVKPYQGLVKKSELHRKLVSLKLPNEDIVLVSLLHNVNLV